MIYPKKRFNKTRLSIKECAQLGILKSDRQNTNKDQQSALNRLKRIEATHQKIKIPPQILLIIEDIIQNNRRCDAKSQNQGLKRQLLAQNQAKRAIIHQNLRLCRDIEAKKKRSRGHLSIQTKMGTLIQESISDFSPSR